MNSQSIGETVPDYDLKVAGAADSERQNLASMVTGKKGGVVLFWSAVCSHCRRYDAYLQKFSARYPEIGLAVIAARQGETEDDLVKCQDERGLDFPILIDADRGVANAWLARQTPRVFLIGADRQLLYRGAIDNFKYPQDPGYEAYLDDAIDDFLNGREVSRSETPGFGCPTESPYYPKT